MRGLLPSALVLGAVALVALLLPLIAVAAALLWTRLREATRPRGPVAVRCGRP